jgi:hypothetical protein
MEIHESIAIYSKLTSNGTKYADSLGSKPNRYPFR